MTTRAVFFTLCDEKRGIFSHYVMSFYTLSDERGPQKPSSEGVSRALISIFNKVFNKGPGRPFGRRLAPSSLREGLDELPTAA